MISISFLFEEGTYFGQEYSYKYGKNPMFPKSTSKAVKEPVTVLNKPISKEKRTNNTFSDY